MDVFQGPFKDGTEGTPDYRYFSALYLLLRVGNELYIIVVFLSSYSNISRHEKWLVSGLFHVFIGMLFFILKPYKKVWMSHVDGFMFTLTGISLIAVMSSLLILKALLFLSVLFVIVFVVYTIFTCIRKCCKSN